MSVKVMAAVWTLDTEPTLKLLLLALADYADSSGICWPSYPTLAARTGVSERQLRRLMRTAEEDGYLLREPGRGRGHSTRYRLTIKGDAHVPNTEPEKGTFETLKGDMGVPLTVTEPLLTSDVRRTPRARRSEIAEALRQARTAINPAIFGHRH